MKEMRKFEVSDSITLSYHKKIPSQIFQYISVNRLKVIIASNYKSNFKYEF